MQIIEPTYITDATFIDTDLTETDEGYPEWLPDISYNYLQRVVITTIGVHSIYECHNTTGNLNRYPPDNLSGMPPYWVYISKTNPWKLFDSIVAPDRASSGAESSMYITITPGAIDTVALLNVDCESINIIMTDPIAGVVYSETKIPAMTTYYNAIYTDLPSYPNATLTITLVNNSASVMVGELVVGKIRTIGTAKYGIGVGLIDFSSKETDAFGNFSILERIYSKRLDVPFTMPMAIHSGLLRLLEKYRSKPLVWIISDLYSTLVAYGFYRDMQLSLPNLSVAECTVTIESLGGDLVNVTAPVEDTFVPWDGNISLLAFMLPTFDGVSTAVIAETPVAETVDLEAFLLVDDPIPILDVYLHRGVCTISNSAPCTVTFAGHGIAENTRVLFKTTGTLPSPLVANRIYYVNTPAIDTFNLKLTIMGSNIDTTTNGSGTHTLYAHD